MTNEQIELAVREVAKLITRVAPVKPGHEVGVAAGIALVTNLLQNINAIASAAKVGAFDRP